MRTLRDRLAGMRSTNAVNPEPNAETDPIDDRWLAIGGRLMSNEYGTFVLRERSFSAYDPHGLYRLAELTDCGDRLSGLATRRQDDMDECASTRLLFFDTETTGLGIGAGNVPFMIGLAFLEEDRFVVRQYFLRSPADERAILYEVCTLLPRFTHIVSYNGRAFDWPILHNRFVLNRFAATGVSIPHIDLLYPSRSLWKHTLPSCRLGTVEQYKLGIRRLDDVPGSLAPTLYFQYLNDGSPAIVHGVFEHNEADLISLACLAVHMGRLLEGRFDDRSMSGEELYRLGMWLDNQGKAELSRRAFERLLELSDRHKLAYLAPLAAYYKKRGEYMRAVELWLACVDNGQLAIGPLIELAMYYEHRSKQFDKALFYAEKALTRAERRSSLGRRNEPFRAVVEDLKKRIRRLESKASRYCGTLV